jgi:hypothetical protein
LELADYVFDLHARHCLGVVKIELAGLRAVRHVKEAVPYLADPGYVSPQAHLHDAQAVEAYVQ